MSYFDSKRIVGTNADRTGSDAVTGGWKEVGRTTLGSAGDTIDVTSLSDKRYYMLLTNFKDTGGQVNTNLTFNNDSGNNYARRWSTNGASDTTQTSRNSLNWHETVVNEGLGVVYISNLSNKEKLLISHSVENSSTGAGSAPDRKEFVGKWANTTTAISSMKHTNSDTGSYDTNSEVVVLGYDPADSHTTNFWEELASGDETSVTSSSTGTISGKRYLWIQAYLEPSSSTRLDINFNNDTGSNYARRGTSNGGSDYTSGSQSQLAVSGTDSSPKFVNIFFVNNSSNEKLGIAHAVNQNTAGAGNAPARQENVLKWSNTSSQITEIDFVQGDGASMDRIVWKVWGSD